ncbi:MAG TPA: hypothetical protein VFC44_21905 [Candidatus Saccharimonadales bacterium]|nr:hypothetical protein [Candidatus Saccharimonadales bacterium]
MHSTLSYLLAAGAGVVIAHFLTRAPELRSMRLAQFVFIPAGMALGVYFLPESGKPSATGDIGGFICFLAVAGFLAVLLAPGITYYSGVGLSNLLDPQDWTPAEEEIALRPIRLLIDKDKYSQALAELDELLKKHKPTYEALLTKAKLLYHFGRVAETEATLANLLPLTKTAAQQLAVMELLVVVEGHSQPPAKPIAEGPRRLEIHHELVLFPMTGDVSPHREIPAGTYQVEETFYRHRRWLKLAGDNWGNAEICWDAVAAMDHSTPAPPKKGLLRQIARMQQACKGKPRRELKAEAQQLFMEAGQCIRQEDWSRALPLLQKATVCDPDRYEIAYRWVQAVRQTGNNAATAEAISQVLKQNQWTENEEQMLQQLRKRSND